MSRPQHIQPLREDSSGRTEPSRRTLDPKNAPTLRLPPSFKLDREQSKRWPDGFWKRVNRAESLYKRGKYLRAKAEYIAAHSLLDSYDRVNTALLRTFRKLYKAAIQAEKWEQANRELSELFETLPSAITDTDRRQYNRVIEHLRSMDPGFAGRPIPLEKKGSRGEKPLADVESANGVVIALAPDEMWTRPKGAKPVKLQENLTTRDGYVAISHTYDRDAGGYVSSRIWTYSANGEGISNKAIEQGFYRVSFGATGDHLIGYSDGLVLSMWTLAGERLAERDVSVAAEGSKYHIRCMGVSEGAKKALFTSSTRAYVLDQSLNTLAIWTMPPPEGYEVGRRGPDMIDRGIQEALSTMQLSGSPSQAEIKTQFRRLALLHHPDRNLDDPTAEDRMKAIIGAYHLLSNEDIRDALEGLEGEEYYYRVVHESEIGIPGMGISIGLTMSVSGTGDWIYASHMTPSADRIYLGGYSGAVYCLDSEGNVLSLYSTDEPIRGIQERNGYLLIWTDGSMYVMESEDLACHLDLRGGSLKCFAQWGFIVKDGSTLRLYSLHGNWLGAVHLAKPVHEIIPTSDGIVVYTARSRFRVSLAGDRIANQ